MSTKKKKRTYPDPKKVKREPKKARRKIAKNMKKLAGQFTSNGGAPTTYDPDFARQAKKLCDYGATDSELADFFGVTIVTIWNWSTRHQEFFNALRRGKDNSNERVERSCYAKAMGYTFDSEKVLVVKGKVVRVQVKEHVPPSDSAMKFWLVNRKREEWKERQDHSFDPDQPLKIIVEGGLPK